MKMPTTASRHKFPWKRGEALSSVGEEFLSRGNHSPNARLTSGPSAMSVTPPARDQRSAKGEAETEVTEVTRSRDSERLVRYPILGPTRQDTELYFRRRRDQKRTLVSRSPEQGEVADLYFRSSSAEKHHFPSSNSHGSIDVWKTSPTTTAALNNSTEHGGGGGHSSVARNSSAPTTTSLLLERGSLPVSSWRGKTANRKSQVPTEFVSVFPHRGKADQTQALQPSSFRRYSPPMVVSGEDEESFGARILKPSKHGFHLRSQSPTFRRLVAVADKLQMALGASSTDCLQPQRRPFFDFGASSRTVVRLPDVNESGAWPEKEEYDVDELQLTANDDVGEEKERRTTIGWLQSSLMKGSEAGHTISSDKLLSSDFVPPSDALRCFQAGADSEGKQAQLPVNDLSPSDGSPHSILVNKAKGHDCEASAEDCDGCWRRENRSSMMREGPNHISEQFLEDFLQPLGLSRQAETTAASRTAVDALPAISASGREAVKGEPAAPIWTQTRSKTMPLEQKLSRENTRLPQTPGRPAATHTNVRHARPGSFRQALTSSHPSCQRDQSPLIQRTPDRSSRLGGTRLNSFTRAARRDVIPKRLQFFASFSGEHREPFLKGERLKERLEDVPTLISQDREGQSDSSIMALRPFQT